MELTLPPGPFKAYLFDCDGTIADTMPLHFKSWNIALGEHGGHFPEDLFYAWAGMALPEQIEMLNEKFNLKMPVNPVIERKEESYFELLPEIKAIESVVHHIKEQHRKIPFAVVSGSPRASVIKTLEILGLTNYFEAIVAGGDYTYGKPHPEPFLKAAQLLGVAPQDCLVFEDADLGIDSAKAAGMAWVRVPMPV